MAKSLPPNNGSAQVLRFERVGTTSMRDFIATGVLNELEYGLLKGSSKAKGGASNDKILGWGVEEKGMLLNMEVEKLMVKQGDMELEVQVRSLCFSRGVTADYLRSHERFNMKQCVLVLGDLGKGAAPWAELVQPAVYLHRKEFNIIWVEVPTFASNPQMWLKFGAEMLRGLLKFLCIKQASVISRGIGGAVFLEALAKAPDLFGRTHFFYNMDIPKGKGVHLPIFEVEEVLRSREIQLWFAFKDDETYDRFVDGTPMKAYDAVQKLQARLIGERQRSTAFTKKRVLNYDEVLITENLNNNPKLPHAKQLKVSIYEIIVFSTPMLESIAFFLEVAPGTHQEGMADGLVGDFRTLATKAIMDGNGADSGEPLAVRRARIGHVHGLTDRCSRASRNAMRLNAVVSATGMMHEALPDLRNSTFAGFPNELDKRLQDLAPDERSSRGGSRGSSRVGSRENSRGNSGPGTKEFGSLTSLPSLKSSASAPSLQAAPSSGAMAAMAALGDDDDDDQDALVDEPPLATMQPWQHYRKMWSEMHGKAPTGYTAPIKEI